MVKVSWALDPLRIPSLMLLESSSSGSLSKCNLHRSREALVSVRKDYCVRCLSFLCRPVDPRSSTDHFLRLLLRITIKAPTGKETRGKAYVSFELSSTRNELYEQQLSEPRLHRFTRVLVLVLVLSTSPDLSFLLL